MGRLAYFSKERGQSCTLPRLPLPLAGFNAEGPLHPQVVSGRAEVGALSANTA